MKPEIAVIGLGKFGLYFASTLVELGHTVIGIDNSVPRVQIARDKLTQVYKADATSQESLEQIGLADVSHVLISVGNSIAASSMIAMYTKEMNIPQGWAKAVTPDHKRLLCKLGVDEVIIPEQMAAIQIASKVVIPGFLQYASFDPDVSFQELTIERWAGKSLQELDLIKKYRRQVIAIKKVGSDKYEYTPDSSYPFQTGDKVIVLRHVCTTEKIRA